MVDGWSFNPPPHWPRPPRGWSPPPGWTPDPEWGPVPPGWQLWVPTPPSRRPWSTVAGVGGALVLAVAVVVWMPRSSDAALAGSPGASGPSGAGLAGALPGDRAETGRGRATSAAPPGAEASAPTPRPGAAGLTAATAPRFASCRALTKAYPHGVGLPGAIDRPGRYRNVRRPDDATERTLRSGGGAGSAGAAPGAASGAASGGGRPSGPPDEPAVVTSSEYPAVTGFGRSTALYVANSPLDEDRDGIACER
ncbi:hypothetical protein [Kineosporia succinea]|uniref:Excalibur calcium-binding domain-containing protein n=1 Tax=Kineosporia succinea TaxID=84632 RepID=A0ABT9NWU2_9ACTN|nr:hypothetical protein [Kineosporia succinea]MDP9824475.1 hypothetical protein [Kineosporia succinea]